MDDLFIAWVGSGLVRVRVRVTFRVRVSQVLGQVRFRVRVSQG